MLDDEGSKHTLGLVKEESLMARVALVNRSPFSALLAIW